MLVGHYTLRIDNCAFFVGLSGSRTLTGTLSGNYYLRPMAKKIVAPKAGARKPGAGSEQRETAPNTLAFSKENYYIILAGIAILVIGYLLMIGGGSDTPKEYNPEIFSTQRITVAPITLLIGFGVVLFGIMKSPKQPVEAPSAN